MAESDMSSEFELQIGRMEIALWGTEEQQEAAFEAMWMRQGGIPIPAEEDLGAAI